MRELSEQEKQAMYEVYSKSDLPHLSGGIVTFQAGFIAGLEYAQSRIDELELKLSAIKVAQSIDTPSFVGLPAKSINALKE